MLNHMKEEGLPSKDIEVAVQNTNKAHCTLSSRQRVIVAGLTGDMCHQAHKNEPSRMDNIVHPTTLGRGVQRNTPKQQALTSREPSIAVKVFWTRLIVILSYMMGSCT